MVAQIDEPATSGSRDRDTAQTSHRPAQTTRGIGSHTIVIASHLFAFNSFFGDRGLMADASTPPNVLLVTTDHWPGRLLGHAGHPSILTPTLDSLAAAGTSFPNAYSECPVCVPARHTLMTGLSPRSHGLRDNGGEGRPAPVSMAQSFRDQGYQAYAVAKMHTKPQRSRFGFDDILLDEEGRANPDDYEIFLADQGHGGQRFAGGMSNNEYVWRPWHLPEDCHVTNWATQQMCRTISRKDPSRPAFWYLGYSHPHPPLAPLQAYLDLYREIPIEAPFYGDWAGGVPDLPERRQREILAIRRAFYALCTHIDHQLRVVIGTMARQGVLDNTIILFTADHGDMLGNHGRWAKRVFFQDAANVPMILSLPAGLQRQEAGTRDPRLVCWADIMPTLHDLCGLPVPGHCDGQSMVNEAPREYLYGECGETRKPSANRMIRRGDYKLIYFPQGNRRLLFHLGKDPKELHDLSEDPAHASALRDLTALLVEELRPLDGDCLSGDALTGLPLSDAKPDQIYRRGLSGQRGFRWV